MWTLRRAMGLQPRPAYVMVAIVLAILASTLPGPSLPKAKKEFFGGLSKASLYSGLFDAGGAFLGFFLTPLWGALSDTHGRVPLIVLTVALTSLPQVALGVVATWDVSLWYYFATKVIGGTASIGLAFAYIADVTTSKGRTAWFGFALVAAFVPIALGPAITLFLSRDQVWQLAAVLSVVTLLYVLLVLPESLHSSAAYGPPFGMTDTPGAEGAGGGGGGGAVAAGTVAVTSDGDGSDDEGLAPPPLVRQASLNPFVSILYVFRHEKLHAVAVLVFCFSFVENGIIETILLYLQNELNYSDRDSARVLLVAGVSAVTTLSLFMAPATRRFGEKRVILFGIAVQTVRVALYCAVWQKWQPLALEVFVGASFMPFPAASGLVSKATPAWEQGMAQGGIAGIRAFCSGLGPLFFSGALALFSSHSKAPVYLPQAPFIVAVPILAFGFFYAWRHIPSRPAAVDELAKGEASASASAGGDGAPSSMDRPLLHAAA